MSATRRRDPKREQFWRETVAAFEKSGLSVRAFCTARDLPETSFFNWRRTLRKRDRQRPAPRSQEVRQPTLVPLRVVPNAVVANAVLEIVLPTGLIVRVPAGAEVSVVAALVTALRTPSC
jgi:transposase-like protein